jgi:hypothetical protein
MRTETIEPTPEEYRKMAEVFWYGIITSSKKGRTDGTIKMTRSLVEVAVYLSHNHPEEYKKLLHPLG